MKQFLPLHLCSSVCVSTGAINSCILFNLYLLQWYTCIKSELRTYFRKNNAIRIIAIDSIIRMILPYRTVSDSMDTY